MNITQHDVAQVDTPTLTRLAIMYGDLRQVGGPLGTFCGVLHVAVIRCLQERRRLEGTAELELLNDDRPGFLVGPDDDPIGDALRELRGETT